MLRRVRDNQAARNFRQRFKQTQQNPLRDLVKYMIAIIIFFLLMYVFMHSVTFIPIGNEKPPSKSSINNISNKPKPDQKKLIIPLAAHNLHQFELQRDDIVIDNDNKKIKPENTKHARNDNIIFKNYMANSTIQKMKTPHLRWRYPEIKLIIRKHETFASNFTISSSSYWHTEQNLTMLYEFNSQKTTLVLMSVVNHEGLVELLKMYGDYWLVFAEIILIWNKFDPKKKITFDSKKLLKDSHSYLVDIIIYLQKQNSIANRWMITKYHRFKTHSVMFIDDDIYASEYQIKCLLNLWNRNKNRIIGSDGYRTLQPTENIPNVYEFGYRALNISNNDAIFNYLLPGWGLTMSIQNAFKLSNILLEYYLFDIIDGQVAHCDDIAIALSFSVIFGENNPIYYAIDHMRPMTDERKRNKVQTAADGHDYVTRKLHRNQCLNLLLNQFIEYGLAYIPVYNHYISNHSISCYKNNLLHCPSSVCYENAKNMVKL
eukprot:506919_1